MCASYSSFQHSSAPHRNSRALAYIVNPLSHRKTAHTPKLNINDLAGAQADGCLRLIFIVDALVETDWRVQFLLQFDVTVQIVPSERLLDHHQVKAFELLQHRPVVEGISGV